MSQWAYIMLRLLSLLKQPKRRGGRMRVPSSCLEIRFSNFNNLSVWFLLSPQKHDRGKQKRSWRAAARSSGSVRVWFPPLHLNYFYTASGRKCSWGVKLHNTFEETTSRNRRAEQKKIQAAAKKKKIKTPSSKNYSSGELKWHGFKAR